MALSKITDEKRAILKQKSAQSLPDVPSLHNWTPKQFKNAITKVLFDNNDSFFAYFNTLTDELEEQFLTKEDDKIVLMETTFSRENEFALEVLKEVENHSKPKIYFASIATSAANKRTVIGIYQKASGGNYVLILDGNGSIKVSNGQTLLPVKFGNLQADLFSFTNGSTTNLTITGTLNATNASVTLPSAEPLYTNHAVPKFYVDNIETKLQDKINGIEAAQNLLDIVGTYNTGDDNLLGYPTINLKKNDKIKVLQDETDGNAGTYYKWTDEKTGVFHWEYIGKDGIYYTQTEVDNKINILEGQITSLRNLINTLTSSNVSYKEE